MNMVIMVNCIDKIKGNRFLTYIFNPALSKAKVNYIEGTI